MNLVTYDILTQRIKKLGNLPAMPAILASLCETLSYSCNQIDLEEVIRQISYDKSLAAQCLRLANSALFRQRGDVATIKHAVMALGLWRIRDLVFSCSLPAMFAGVSSGLCKGTVWRHAFGTAVVAHGLGEQLGVQPLETVYLAGLLHDIGVLVNALLFHEDFEDILEEARQKRLPLELAEQHILGFTHAESGRILAEIWRLPVELADVIEYHEHPQKQGTPNETSVLVHAADLVCQTMGLGCGYDLDSSEATSLPRIWETLGAHFPASRSMNEDAYSKLLLHLVSEARQLANHVFTPVLAED